MRNIKAYKLALAVLIVLMLSAGVASAAPVGGRGGTPYCENVTFTNVYIKDPTSCVPLVKWCAASITVRWHGMEFWTITHGWNLRQGQRISVNATVCTNGSVTWN